MKKRKAETSEASGSENGSAAAEDITQGWRCEKALDVSNIIQGRRTSKASEIYKYDIFPKNYVRTPKPTPSNPRKQSVVADPSDVKKTVKSIGKKRSRTVSSVNASTSAARPSTDSRPPRPAPPKRAAAEESIPSSVPRSHQLPQIPPVPQLAHFSAPGKGIDGTARFIVEGRRCAACRESCVEGSEKLEQPDVDKCIGRKMLSGSQAMKAGDFVFLRCATEEDVARSLEAEQQWGPPDSNTPVGDALIGNRVRIWWDGDTRWYEGIVEGYKSKEADEAGKKGGDDTYKVRYCGDGLVAKEHLEVPGKDGDSEITSADKKTIWQIRKFAPRRRDLTCRNIVALTPLPGKGEACGRLGDAVDEVSQLEENWRWASNYWKWHTGARSAAGASPLVPPSTSQVENGDKNNINSVHNSKAGEIDSMDAAGDGLFPPIGRVVEVDSSGSGRLLVSRVWYPQDTRSGLDPAVHGQAEVFEGCRLPPGDWLDPTTGGLSKDVLTRLQPILVWVPVCIARRLARVHPCRSGRLNPCASKVAHHPHCTKTEFFLSHKYCPELDAYFPIETVSSRREDTSAVHSPAVVAKTTLLKKKYSRGISGEDFDDIATAAASGDTAHESGGTEHTHCDVHVFLCHRCRRVTGDLMLCCGDGCGRRFCKPCSGVSGARPPLEGWLGPCCRGTCSCSTCVSSAQEAVHSGWSASVGQSYSPPPITSSVSSKSAPPSEPPCSISSVTPVPVAFCHTCGHSGASASLVTCYYCDYSTHCTSREGGGGCGCLSIADRESREAMAQCGVDPSSGLAVHAPAGDGAIGHGLAVVVDGKWRAAIVVAYRPLQDQHRLDILPGARGSLPAELRWAKLSGAGALEVQWEVVHASVSEGQVDSSVKGEHLEDLRHALRALSDRRLAADPPVGLDKNKNSYSKNGNGYGNGHTVGHHSATDTEKYIPLGISLPPGGVCSSDKISSMVGKGGRDRLWVCPSCISKKLHRLQRRIRLRYTDGGKELLAQDRRLSQAAYHKANGMMNGCRPVFSQVDDMDFVDEEERRGNRRLRWICEGGGFGTRAGTWCNLFLPDAKLLGCFGGGHGRSGGPTEDPSVTAMAQLLGGLESTLPRAFTLPWNITRAVDPLTIRPETVRRRKKRSHATDDDGDDKRVRTKPRKTGLAIKSVAFEEAEVEAAAAFEARERGGGGLFQGGDGAGRNMGCARCRPYSHTKRRAHIMHSPRKASASTNGPTKGPGASTSVLSTSVNGAADDDESRAAGDTFSVRGNSISKDRLQRISLRRFRKEGQDLVDTGLLRLDLLQARRKRLRFGRSPIHAWGVFADEPIGAGDLVIEYRGEIIRNTVADKREKLYAEMQVGSDYMFRIDEDTVIDATFKGSLARFVNHSCDPNCYTQIIAVDGVKKIIIYAKRAVKQGEELCYDYKFPMEESEEDRVACHCGAAKCRRFMN